MSSSTTMCLEPLLLEPRELMPSSKSFSYFSNMQDSLSKPSHITKHAQEPYIHPLLPKPFLSSKSLEMCTESLGTETGSGIDQSSHLAAAENGGGIQRERKKKKPTKKAQQGSGGFPPPLTSISRSGGGGVQVHTHREGGRLVIKAFASSSGGSFFRAERGDGRLRLSLVKDGGGEEGFGGRFWGENMKEEGGKVWSSSSNRCNEDSSRKKRLQSLQFCVVGV